MIVFVCVDERNGMMFNHRRLSQDRALRSDLLKLTVASRLWMNQYSRSQFPEDASIQADENFLSLAGSDDYCFVEDQDLTPWKNKIKKIILFRWNRSYPADQYFNPHLLEGRTLVFTEEFRGFSHEKITREDYE